MSHRGSSGGRPPQAHRALGARLFGRTGVLGDRAIPAVRRRAVQTAVVACAGGVTFFGGLGRAGGGKRSAAGSLTRLAWQNPR